MPTKKERKRCQHCGGRFLRELMDPIVQGYGSIKWVCKQCPEKNDNKTNFYGQRNNFNKIH